MTPRYNILRNGQPFGPYDAGALAHYVSDGRILLQDLAQEEGTAGPWRTVREVLKAAGTPARAKAAKSLGAQIRGLGWGMLLPKSSFHWQTFSRDKRFLLVAIVGLAPAFLIRFAGATILTFYGIALYFSLIWGLFFYSIFKTPQVELKKAVAVFFGTQALILLMVEGLRIPAIHPLYNLIESPNILARFLGFTAGVGVFEEAVKAAPLFWLGWRARGPLLPQTLVFYGLMSGIGFGVFEGVIYQLGANRALDYSEGFFMNIARLTSLPFLHAVWAAIAGYFISLSFLYPKSRTSLWVLAILIPALLHGMYDTLGWSIPGLLVSYTGVGLLVVYLQKAKEFGSRLIR